MKGGINQMVIFIILSDYFDTGVFGSYSTMKRARMAIENFFEEEEDIVSYADFGAYSYRITTASGKKHIVSIDYDEVDYEFRSGRLKDE